MLNPININDLVAEVKDSYFQGLLTETNDHSVRVSVMNTPYHWHYHPNSDETFVCLQGTILLETEVGNYELTPGTIVTVPKNVRHRTQPKGGQSVNLLIEQRDIETVNV